MRIDTSSKWDSNVSPGASTPPPPPHTLIAQIQQSSLLARAMLEQMACLALCLQSLVHEKVWLFHALESGFGFMLKPKLQYICANL